jgi:hypothetical protein
MTSIEGTGVCALPSFTPTIAIASTIVKRMVFRRRRRATPASDASATEIASSANGPTAGADTGAAAGSTVIDSSPTGWTGGVKKSDHRLTTMV